MSGAGPQDGAEAVDPDIDLHVRGQRREAAEHHAVLPAIALGGMAGAGARYALELAWPTPVGGLPWSTLVTNVSGCLLIGLLMVHVVEVGGAHPLVRPFLGVGVLGGYTTFSTYAVQAHALLTDGRAWLALAYLFGTLVAALVAVVVGVLLGRLLVDVRRRSSRRPVDLRRRPTRRRSGPR